MRRLGYYTDHNERGEYQASVRDLETDDVVLSIASDEYGSVDLIDDGYMRNIDDMDGLLDYLFSVGLVRSGVSLRVITR